MTSVTFLEILCQGNTVIAQHVRALTLLLIMGSVGHTENISLGVRTSDEPEAAGGGGW